MWTIRIYGSVTNHGNTVAKSTLDSEGNYLEVDVMGIDASFEYEDENKHDLSGGITTKSIIRPKFEIKIAPGEFNVNSGSSDLQTFYNTDVFQASYHYIWFNNYPIGDENANTTTCIKVAITDLSIEHNYELGMKELVITMKRAF